MWTKRASLIAVVVCSGLGLAIAAVTAAGGRAVPAGDPAPVEAPVQPAKGPAPVIQAQVLDETHPLALQFRGC